MNEFEMNENHREKRKESRVFLLYFRARWMLG